MTQKINTLRDIYVKTRPSYYLGSLSYPALHRYSHYEYIGYSFSIVFLFVFVHSPACYVRNLGLSPDVRSLQKSGSDIIYSRVSRPSTAIYC